MATVLRHGAPKGRMKSREPEGALAVWLGKHLYTNPSPLGLMARRKMFKQLALVKTENVGHTGGSYAIAACKKQQDSFVSAWVDKVRIAYHLDVTDVPDSRPAQVGVSFYACTVGTGGPNSDNLIAVSATRGYGGTVTLDLKRSIKENEYDSDSGMGQIAIWMQVSDLDLAAGDVTANLACEAYGRWHTIVGV